MMKYFTESQQAEIIELYNDEDFESVMEYCDEILSNDSNHKGAIFFLANVLTHPYIELWERAIDIYKKARELNIDFEHDDYHNFALALTRCQRLDEAKTEISIAMGMPESDENTKKLYDEIMNSENQQSSPEIECELRKENGKMIISIKKNETVSDYVVKSITKDEFQPILELQKKHAKMEESGEVATLTEEQIKEIEKEWFETVLSIGLETFSDDMLKTLSNEEISNLTSHTFVILNDQLQSNSPNPEDLRNGFDRFSWQEMEDMVGELFEKKGYSTQVGVSSSGGMKRSGDFGIDVRASNDIISIGIQVKHHSSNVDFDTIAKTLGVSQDFDKVLVINTKTGFTPQAITFANNEKKLELWDSNRFNEEISEYFF